VVLSGRCIVIFSGWCLVLGRQGIESPTWTVCIVTFLFAVVVIVAIVALFLVVGGRVIFVRKHPEG
jgi:hypothetical protein